MIVLATCLLLASFSTPGHSQGAPWTPEETLAIYKKLYKLAENPHGVRFKYKQIKGDDLPDYHTKTNPSAPKMLRLAFHDCIPYDDGEPGGCDGCLNPTGMMINMLTYYNTNKFQYNGPDVVMTNNNGLLYTADILEEIYTNPNFPDYNDVPALEVSMKDSGKSRADLWAFAGLVAAQYGIENNNKACLGNPRDACGHVYSLEENCDVTWNQVPVFKTGRKDCEPDPSLDRPFFTQRHEAHPNPQANGPTTVDYYADKFNMTAREAIALTEGAHSFGKFNVEISMMPYFWTRSQDKLMNNQLFRQIAERPQYFMDCKDHSGKSEYRLVGDAYGQPAETTWVTWRLGMSKNGGPYHWFHRYNRCPASNACAAIDLGQDRLEPNTPNGCCDNLEAGMQCQPSCQRDIQNDETAIAIDVGFYHKFQADPDTGRPSGCPGFEDNKWKQGKRNMVYPKCDKEDYAPQGEPLYAIVDDYADHLQKWMDDFFPVLEKMSSNGCADLTLNPFNILDH